MSSPDELARKVIKAKGKNTTHILAQAVLDKQERIDRLVDCIEEWEADCEKAEAHVTALRTALEGLRHAIRTFAHPIEPCVLNLIDTINTALSATPPAVPDTTAIVEAARNLAESGLIHFSRSTDKNDEEFRGCRVCEWTWTSGQLQRHEPGCSVALLFEVLVARDQALESE